MYKKARRSKILITQFPDRTDANQRQFAPGWKFAVHDSFKDSLDIKLTDVIKKGTKEKTKTWTQGKYYSFSEGDIIYDSPDGYLEKGNTYPDFKILLQVMVAAPASLNVFGFVRFQLFRKNSGSEIIKRETVYNCTQFEFVRLLKTGIFSQLQDNEDIKII